MKSLFLYLFPWLKSYRLQIILTFLLSFVLAITKFYQAYLVKPLFDKGLTPNAQFSDTLDFALILLSVSLLHFPARFFYLYLLRTTVEKIGCEIRNKLYAHLQKIPISYFAEEKVGEYISKLISDTQNLVNGITAFNEMVKDPLIACAMLGLALYRDWQLTLVILILSPLFVMIFIKTGKKVQKSQTSVQQHLGEMSHFALEGLQGQKIIKAFNLGPFIINRFIKAQEKFFFYLKKGIKTEEVASPLVEFVGVFGFVAIIILAHQRITSKAMTQGDFISFITAMALFLDPVRKFSRTNIKINLAKASLKRIQELFKLPTEEVIEKNSLPLSFNQELVLKGLSFSYKSAQDATKKLVLDKVTLRIPKKKKVALVGASGSGKSTLINLILRLLPSQEGSILLDNIPIEQLPLLEYRDLFGVVTQDIFLINDTVKVNITMGRNVSAQEIEEALIVSHSKEFVAQLPLGLDTIIGDRGTKLSGGQCQRLTIARAFLSKCPILLFDEATSALDNESEKIVSNALDQLAENKTVVAVAHRLTTIKDFDSIYVFKDGKIIEEGTHQSLLAINGEYARLFYIHGQ